ncbi:MAG TPA: hypothetical protein VMV31_02795 [Terriglobales bacterium]|nr:hypothetical protein [Terriglobales bacterium]
MIHWRPYQPGDEAALRRRHEAQGGLFAFPELSADPRYLLVEVAERDGEVAGAFVAHATIEVYLLGADAGVARAALKEGPRWRRQLQAIGADEAHAFVPRAVVGGMEPLLRRVGLRRSNESFVPFYCEL